MSGKWDGRVKTRVVSMIPHKWMKQMLWISILCANYSSSLWCGQNSIQENRNYVRDLNSVKWLMLTPPCLRTHQEISVCWSTASFLQIPNLQSIHKSAEWEWLTLLEDYWNGQQWTSSFNINILLISSKGKIEQNHNILGWVANFFNGEGLDKNRLSYFVKC